MSVVCVILDEYDVLDGNTEPPPLSAYDPAPTAPNDPRLLEDLAVESPDPRRVPAFKLRSNDLQTLTPRECQVIATVLRQADTAVIARTAAGLQNLTRTLAMRDETDSSDDEWFPDSHPAAVVTEADHLEDVRGILLEFAAFCERAADSGGFFVV